MSQFWLNRRFQNISIDILKVFNYLDFQILDDDDLGRRYFVFLLKDEQNSFGFYLVLVKVSFHNRCFSDSTRRKRRQVDGCGMMHDCGQKEEAKRGKLSHTTLRICEARVRL